MWFSLSRSLMGWERGVYFKSGDLDLLMKMWLELIISGKVTYTPCNFTSVPSCLLSGHDKFMVLYCNSSRGLKRTLICTTSAGGNRDSQSLIPEFPRGPWNHFWNVLRVKSAVQEGWELCVWFFLQELGPLISVTLLLCIRCLMKACEDCEQKFTEQEGGQERVAGWHHLSTWVS